LKAVHSRIGDTCLIVILIGVYHKAESGSSPSDRSVCILGGRHTAGEQNRQRALLR